MGDEELYEEEIADSDSIRTEQARELDAWSRRSMDDRSSLSALFRPDYRSMEAYTSSTRRLREALRNQLGYPPPGRPDREEVEIREVGEDRIAAYHRIRIPVLPGIHAVGLYLVPKRRRENAPLVVSMHGGGGSPEMATFQGGANYHDMVRGAAERGYCVFAPQHLFQAEGWPSDIRQRIDSRMRLFGTTLVAVEIAKIARGLDVLLKREEVDPERVAMVGLSYGGFYTLYAMALESRIRAGVSSCFFGDVAERLVASEPHGWSDLRFPDGLRFFRDPEIVALICPRPLEVQMGIHDDLIRIEPARRTAPLAGEPYRRLGCPERFRFTAFDGGHEFHGASAWEFLSEHL